MGEPASSPRNSPICHWRVSSHSASRTSARSARSNLSARGRPSSRFQMVIPGLDFSEITLLSSAVMSFSAMSDPLYRLRNAIVERQVRRDGELLHMRGHDRRRQEPRVWSDVYM